ncbi:hypothetical protein [Abditibacterium utsteinense]|nr:hypothetical protein [Abditibacterium utsteinense]
MQRFSRKWLRGWAGMALFAMLAVLTSPALAFACCCSQEIASAQAPQNSRAIIQAPELHPDCHDHASASRVSSSASSPTAVGVTSAASGPCFKSLCECAPTTDNVVAFVESQNSSSFLPLVLGVTTPAFSPTVAPPSSVRFAFAFNAAKPRGPDTASRSGRAPPAFSL